MTRIVRHTDCTTIRCPPRLSYSTMVETTNGESDIAVRNIEEVIIIISRDMEIYCLRELDKRVKKWEGQALCWYKQLG